jgi:hypothetical protein
MPLGMSPAKVPTMKMQRSAKLGGAFPPASALKVVAQKALLKSAGMYWSQD